MARLSTYGRVAAKARFGRRRRSAEICRCLGPEFPLSAWSASEGTDQSVGPHPDAVDGVLPMVLMWADGVVFTTASVSRPSPSSPVVEFSTLESAVGGQALFVMVQFPGRCPTWYSAMVEA